MIHYENMTKEQVIGILKDAEEYIGEVHKDYDAQKEEIERLNNIIENAIKKCEYLLKNNEIEINNKKYYKQKCDDIITNFIYEELKGVDKE